MKFRFYTQPFNTKEPPPANRDMRQAGFAGWRETKKSKQRTKESELRLAQYRQTIAKPG